MDIKIPSDLPAPKPAVSQVGDLLAQLKAAGTIEAEVVKLLQGNKLLLSTRLGNILSSNSLNYKPGDRLNLRLDDSAQQAVLKSSPRPARSIILDSRQNPDLSRALTPDQPALARVIKIVAQQAEIQLAEQILRLPRQVALPRNQLISLQRNDNRQSIEITRVDSKAIYKAIVKQLVPQQGENGTSSLIRLLNLISISADKSRRASTQPAAVNRQQPVTSSVAASVAGAKSGTGAITIDPLKPSLNKPDGDRLPVTTTNLSSIPGKATVPVSPGRPGPAARLLAAIDSRNMPPSALQVASIANQVASPGTAARGSSKTARSAQASMPETRIAATPQRQSAMRVEPAAIASTNASPASNISVDQSGIGRAIPHNKVQAESFQGLPLAAGQALQPGPAQAAGLTAPAAGASAAVPPTLQPLLQLVTRFPEIDATQIKKWLEFARLIYPPRSTDSATPAPDIFRVLKQFGDSESLNRELTQFLQQNPKARADGDSPAARAQAQEVLLLQLRDGVKLIEQSLSQNLLQRATLGLQQETQQPLSLSFALPYSADQETKPLYIDLAQRSRAQEGDEKSWDIRLNFELSGLGPISCHLVLEGRTIAASFYSEQAQTRERIETELPQLRQQLVRAGFTPGEFQSFPGRPTPKRGPTAADFSEALVDIEV